MIREESIFFFESLFKEKDNDTLETLRLSMTHSSAKVLMQPDFSKANIKSDATARFSALGHRIVSLYSYIVSMETTNLDTSGKLSLKSYELKKIIDASLSEFMEESNHGIFGPGELKNKKSQKVWLFISYQFIGAISYKLGLDVALRFLKTFKISNSTLKVAKKDGKTLLQEILQRSKKKLPTYELIEKTGPEHISQFHAIVKSDDGTSAVGIGTSKKLAEQDAANNYVIKYIPQKIIAELNNESTIKNKKTSQDSYYYPQKNHANSRKIKSLTSELTYKEDINELLLLALTHCSYGQNQKVDRYGANNDILSFLGSAALSWALSDIVTRIYLRSDVYFESTPNTDTITGSLLSSYSISKILDHLNIQEEILIGKSQRELNKEIKSNVVQALVGFLFLNRRGFIFSGSDLLKSRSNKILSWAEVNIERLLSENTENIVSSKTYLQEKCQSIGVSIVYDSQNDLGKDQSHISKVKAKIINQDGSESLIASFVKKDDLIQSKKTLESHLAKSISGIFDIVNGIDSEVKYNSLISFDQKKIADFFTRQIIKRIKNPANIKNLANKKILGINFAKNDNRYDFSQWLAFTKNSFDQQSIENLLELYQCAGQLEFNHDDIHSEISQLIDGLYDYLKSLDPLKSCLPIKESIFFRKINDSAKLLKLMGKPVKINRFDEIRDDFLFVSRHKLIDIVLSDSIKELSVAEVDGVYLIFLQSLIDMIEKTKNNDQKIKLIFLLMENKITIEINDVFCSEEEAQKFITNLDEEKSILWLFMKKIVFITNIRKENKSIFIVIDAVIGSDDLAILTKRLLLAYKVGHPITQMLSDTASRVLHDLKNELLAYQSAKNQITSTSISKYTLAAEAEKHVNIAKDYINALSTILRSSNDIKLDSASLALFFRDFIISLLNSSPTTVTIKPPTSVKDAIFHTDFNYLRSILTNLCKNSIDAMDKKGNLFIDWLYDEKINILEIEIRDEGCGFTEKQLEDIKNRNPIYSSKKDGAGIGLSSVIIMVEKIDGTIEIQSKHKKGSTINIYIPSLTPDDDELMLSKDVTSSEFENTKDTIEL